MHPFNEHREHHVSRKRVHHLMKSGGHARPRHTDEAEDRKLIHREIKRALHHEHKVHGHKGKHRYARGGKVKHKAEGGEVDSPQNQNQWSDLHSKITNPYQEPQKHGCARGGKVKGKGKGHHTNITIVVPHHPPNAAGPQPGAPPPSMPASAAPAPQMNPMAGGMPGGMPMRASGGRVIAGEATKENIKKWDKRTQSNSRHRGKAAEWRATDKSDAGFERKHPSSGLHQRAGASTGEGRLEQAHYEARKRKVR